MWTAFYDEYSGSCGDYSAYRGNIFTPFISDALQEHILADALEGKRVILVDKDKMAKELWEKVCSTASNGFFRRRWLSIVWSVFFVALEEAPESDARPFAH